MDRTQGTQAVHLSEEFVANLVQELDNDDIIGITLGGSYARGEATQYSDLDFACFWRVGLRPPPKRFMYRQGKLISVKMTTVDEIRGMLSRPESALLFASGKHRLLLDKDGSVARLLEEIANFRWETLQPVANWSTNIWMMLKAEEVHKLLADFQRGNEPGIAYAVAKLVAEMTTRLALYCGVLITSDSTYYSQVEEAAGSASAWTYNHRIATGLDAGPENIKPIRARGIAALFLYRETLALLKPAMRDEQLAVAEQALQIVREAVDQLPFTAEEYQWLKNWT